jgi:O-antigen/teichoic acid export membrane protein
VKNAAFFVVSALKVAAILMNLPLLVLGALETVENILGAIGLIAAYSVEGHSAGTWKFRWTTARVLLSDSWPLILSSVGIVTYMKIDQVLLGGMIDSATVGIYAAAVRMVEVWYFIPSAITISVFPTIVRARTNDPALYERRLQQLYDLIALVSLGLAFVVTILSRIIMLWMYGPEYIPGASVLTIYVWSGVATFLGVASSQYLMAENLAQLSMYRTLLGMIANIALNLILIPAYGMIGSAIATLFSYFLATFGLVLFPQTRAHTVMLLRSLNVARHLVRR